MNYGYGGYGGQQQMEGFGGIGAQMPPVSYRPVDPEEQRKKLKLLGLEDSALDKMFSARSKLGESKKDFSSAIKDTIVGKGGGEAIKSAAGGMSGAAGSLLKAL